MLVPLSSHRAPPSKCVPPLWLLFHPFVIWLTWATILTPGLRPNSLRHLMALIPPPGASPPESCELNLVFCYPSLFFFPSLASLVCPPRHCCMSKYRGTRILIVMCVNQIKSRINTGSLPCFFTILAPLYFSQGSWATTCRRLIKLVLRNARGPPGNSNSSFHQDIWANGSAQYTHRRVIQAFVSFLTYQCRNLHLSPTYTWMTSPD